MEFVAWRVAEACDEFVLMNITAVAALLVLTSAPAPPTERQLAVMAYNVLYDSTAIEKSLDAIETADADVVCLRELSSKFANAFEKRLARKYPYRSLHPKKSGTWGVGIASRFRLSGSTVFEQKPHRLPALEARVATPHGPVLVSCLHLFPPVGKHRKSDGLFETMEKNAELRQKQAEYVVSRYAKVQGPVLILGDMNEDALGKALQAFEKAGFQRACEIPNQECGATFPGATSALPAVFEIDHILGRGVTFGSARVLKAGGSDHYPVFATLSPSP